MQKKMIISLMLLQAYSLTALATKLAVEHLNKTESSSSPDIAAQGTPLMLQALQQHQWQLVTYLTPQGMQSTLPEHLATMIFSGRKVSGSTGCNQYFSGYQLEGQHGLQFSQPGSTMMACQGGLAQQEQQYLKNLLAIRYYHIQGKQLQLFDAEQTVRMTYKVIPVLKLNDNTWYITGINNGHGGVVSRAQTSQAYLQFIKGKLHGNSGCNVLAANYQTEESELNIGSVSSTRKICVDEDLMIQEQQLLQAITQVTYYEIRIDQLRLLNVNGSLMISLKLHKSGHQ